MSAALGTVAALLRREKFVALLYVVAAAWVFGMWVWGADTTVTSLNGDPRSTLSGLIYGTAHRPYVERVLVPVATRTVHAILPQEWRAGARELFAGSAKAQKEMARLGWETGYVSEYLIALTLAALALVAFPFACRRLFARLYSTEAAVVNVAPLAVLAVLPPMFLSGTHYIYDFPALLFFTAGLVLLMERRWHWYYPLYIIGCLNKETMVLMTLALVLIHGATLARGELLLHGGVHLALFGVIKASLMAAFASQPGRTLEVHAIGNIHNLLLPYSAGTLLTMAVVLVMVFADWQSKHPALRRLLWLVAPFLLLMFCFAWLHELRDLYEIVPVVVLLAVHTAAFTWGGVAYSWKPLTRSTLYQMKGANIEHGR